MPTTVPGAFQEFAARLEPTKVQRSDAATKSTGVKDCLGQTLYVEQAFLTGSYARWTIIRPPDDIDLFVVLDYSKHGAAYYTAYNSAQAALERFHSRLKSCYPLTPIRKDQPAVHLNFATYGFDVAPAFRRNGGGYMIPIRTGSGWMATDPTKHAARTTAMNQATGYYFIPLVKMFKSWNRTRFGNLRGFHLEMALANAWPRLGNNPVGYRGYAEAAAALFPALSAQLAYMSPDPAELSGNIDDYLPYEQRQRTRERLQAAGQEAQIALRHETRGDSHSAISKWRSIFLDPFPAYS